MADDLTAEEIAALREALSAGQAESRGSGRGHVRRYDFRVPDKFSKEQVRALVHLHDGMTRALTTTLSAHLRTTVEMEPPVVEQVTHQHFVSRLPQPAIVGIVELPPLDGSALIQLDASLAYPMIDRMMGGPGAGMALDRPMTEIEAIIIRRVLGHVLDCWCATWQPVQAVRGRLVGVEANPLFVQVAADNDIVLQVSLEAHMGRQTGFLRLCLPFTMIEPVLGQIVSRQWYQRLSQRERPEQREGLTRSLAEVRVGVEAHLGTVHLRLRELLDLEPGDLVPFGSRSGQSATLLVNGRPKFAGRPGRVGGRLGVEVTGRLDG
jgi:flagellar motor switch protein FliM